MTFAEVMAMYLLVWSPVPWQLVDLGIPRGSATSIKPDTGKSCR